MSSNGQNGAAALGKLGRAAYNIVVSEWSMEPVSGLQLLKFLRAGQNSANIPFMMVTKRSDAGSRELALQAGANICIDDNASLSEIESAITQILLVAGEDYRAD